MHQMFRREAFEQRAARGELTTKQVYYHHVDPPLEFEPLCTHSVRLAYFNAARERLAEVHYYERPDGSIGASGVLDPKEVVVGGVLHYLDRS